MRSRRRSSKTIVRRRRRNQGLPEIAYRGVVIRLLPLVLALLSSTSSFAAGYISARIGGGWVHLDKGDTATYSGTVRLGNEQPDWKTMIGLDLSAFRFLETEGLPSEIDGNAATAVIGSYALGGTIWAGFGAGELRSYERPAPNENDPYGFFTRLWEIGVSGDIYEADFGRVELCALFRQLRPESKWRHYSGGTDRIDTLLFEVGLRLGNW